MLMAEVKTKVVLITQSELQLNVFTLSMFGLLTKRRTRNLNGQILTLPEVNCD